MNKRMESVIDSLLSEIELLRQEKAVEFVLRTEAEKQIDLAAQKYEEIQKRMEDWKRVQDAAMKDSMSAMINISNDLYKKLTKNLKIEVDEVKNLLEQINKKLNP